MNVEEEWEEDGALALQSRHLFAGNKLSASLSQCSWSAEQSQQLPQLDV